ncbi:MAG: MFS transporter [Acidimicrobiales bacterium]
MLALGALSAAGTLQAHAVLALGPAMADALGLGPAVLAGLTALTPLVVVMAALPLAATVSLRSRATVAVLAGVAASGALLLLGTAPGALAIAHHHVVGGFAGAALPAFHLPMLVDAHPPGLRVRAVSAHRLGEVAGIAVVFGTGAALMSGFGLTWRAVLVMLSVIAAANVAWAYRLRSPVAGRWDTARLRQAAVPERDEASPEPRPSLGAAEIARRVLLIPTARGLLVANAVLGLCGLPLMAYVLFFLEARWGLGPGARGLVVSGFGAVAVIGLMLAAPRADILFAEDPARLLRAAAIELGAGLLALALSAIVPLEIASIALLAIAFSAVAVVKPAIDVALLSLVPPEMRPHASALAGTCLAAASAVGGIALLAGMDRRFGPGGALVVAALVGSQGVAALRASATKVHDDLDRLIAETVEDAELGYLGRTGAHLPILACRHLDFSYGPLQVLFDVDLTVDEGEMVALLGTNGAGKSTLLRVISGLGLPDRGTVRFSGVDITFVDAERRTRMGISQVPGGRGVYRPLTVLENLRVIGYSRGRDRRKLEQGLEATFEAFPRLAERRSQPAATLSGGEQQMLALARAYILQPRLLLIDELSLGLAPKVVAELLDIVRRINANGTAVVVVEQSVNIALSLVNHAYFMEKGEVRFDGTATDLLARPDLLRSVFLEGAARTQGARR